jgi:hypothetical protein
MEAVITSKTSVNFYQTTRPNNPKDTYLHIRRRVNLKSHIFDAVQWSLSMPYKITNSMKAESRSSGKEIPLLLWNLMAHYRVYKSPPQGPIQSQINPLHILFIWDPF